MAAIVSTPTKTIGTALLAHTQQATATVTVGSAVTVTAFSGKVSIKIGRTTSTALAAEILFRLEGAFTGTNNDEWATLYSFTSSTCKTTASSTTLNGATSANDATFVVTSATGIIAGDWLYLRETGTPANSEWVEVKSMSGTTVTPFNNLTRAHTNSINVADTAETITFDVDLTGLSKIRLIVDTATTATTTTADVIAWINTFDNVSSV